MVDDEKLEKLEVLLTSDTLSQPQETEMIGLALSVDDREEKAEALEKVAVKVAKNGRFDKAYELLGRIEAIYLRTEGSTKIAALLISLDRNIEAHKFLQYAESSAIHGEERHQVARLLNDIATCYLAMHDRDYAMGLIDRAISIAREGELTGDIHDSFENADALLDVVNTFVKLGDKQRAYEIATAIKNSVRREQALKWLETKF